LNSSASESVPACLIQRQDSGSKRSYRVALLPLASNATACCFKLPVSGETSTHSFQCTSL
jgi:hypothetical protein